MNEESDDLTMVKDYCAKLGEHFDSVQIFCTRKEEGSSGTININWGSGNWFARYGQVRQWFIKSDEDDRLEVRKDNE